MWQIVVSVRSLSNSDRSVSFRQRKRGKPLRVILAGSVKSEGRHWHGQVAAACQEFGKDQRVILKQIRADPPRA